MAREKYKFLVHKGEKLGNATDLTINMKKQMGLLTLGH